MLPLSANSDYKNIDKLKLNSPYYDLNSDLVNTEKVEVYGTEALDQSIEIVLCTEPLERPFNVNLWSPLYTLLFENMTNLESKLDDVFDAIENWVPIKIDRSKSEIQAVPENNAIVFKIPYFYDFHGEIRAHIFKRMIGR